MKTALDGEVVVDDLGDDHLQQRKKDPFGRLAQPRVFHRRLADDRRGVDRVAAVGHALHVEGRITIREAVDAGVVAERSFDAQIGVVDVAFEHELGVGRHLEVDGAAAYQLDGLAPQEAGEGELVDDRRQGRGGRVRQRGVGADDDRHRHSPAPRGGLRAALLVALPMHPRRALVVDLHPVHADVLRAGARIFGDDQRQRHERPAVERPGRQHRQRPQVGFLDDVVRAPVFDGARNGARERRERGELEELARDGRRHREVDRAADAAGDLVERVGAQRERHPARRAELIGQHRIPRALDVGEQQGRAAGFDHAVGDF